MRVPGSKSLTNRALVIAALARGESTLVGASESDDSRHLVTALGALGFEASLDRVVGRGGSIPATSAELAVGNAGTAFRFLTAMVCLGRGSYRLDGDPRMRERPIRGLVDALRALGAAIHYGAADGCPPLTVVAGGLRGGRVRVAGDTSSQFVSALLMAAPCASAPVELEVVDAVSRPYIEMTIGVMASFGAQAQVASTGWRVAAGGYRAQRYDVEADAAAAGYHFARAAVTGKAVSVEGLGAGCRQPEYRLVDDLAAMGARVVKSAGATEVAGGELRGIDVDMNDRPDSVQTLAVVALFAKGRTRIRNVRNLRVKETDRLAALARELAKCGARVVEHADGIEIEPPAVVRGAEIETYGDHRMAMSFAVVPGATILNPEVVSKSYPGFWRDWS